MLGWSARHLRTPPETTVTGKSLAQICLDDRVWPEIAQLAGEAGDRLTGGNCMPQNAYYRPPKIFELDVIIKVLMDEKMNVRKVVCKSA